MEDIYVILIFLFIALIGFVIFWFWCIFGCPMPEESKQVEIASKIIVEKDPVKQEEIRKLPPIYAKLFFPENRDSWKNRYLYVCRDNLDAEQAKFCLNVLLANGGDKSSLQTYESSTYKYDVMKDILTFLEYKAFIKVTSYIFPEVVDECGLIVKHAAKYLVIDITDLGRKYVEEVK